PGIGFNPELAAEIRTQPGVDPEMVVPLTILVMFITVTVLALVFAFWNWLLWPIIVFFTGQVVIWTFGLFLVVINTVIFYWAIGLGDNGAIVAVEPVWLWTMLGGCLMTAWLFVLEGITGLDSPLKDRPNRGRRYWRVLGRLNLGGRNYFAENRRIAQSIDTMTRYGKDIIFDSIPVLGSIRRGFQRVIYWRRKPLVNESAAETVRYMLQDLGPTFVKLGQIVSSRSEDLPPEWRTQLARLQSQVEPFPYAEAERIITTQLGRPPAEIFATLDQKPLAAASTAQVHRAALPDGTAVVVKVQRPDIDVTVRADLNVVRDLTRLAQHRFAWARKSDIAGITREYADNILLELDYTNEAFNGRLLAQNMATFPNVHVPIVYTEFSCARVMVQEFVKGVKITNVAAINAAGLDRTGLAMVFMRAMVKQVLYDGFFHGDPHPGNVLVDTDTGKIIFLDLGMMGTLTSGKRLVLADLIWSLAERDNRELAKVVLGLTTSYSEVDEDRFIQDVERLMQRYTAFADMNMSLAAAMGAMFDALARAGLRLDTDLTLALKAMIQAEETVRTLDPQLPLIEALLAATKELFRTNFDVERVTSMLRVQALRAAKDVIRNIPAFEDAVQSWIKQFQRGRLTVYVETSQLEEQIRLVNTSVTTNARGLMLSLMLVGLLIGASIASNARSEYVPNLPEIAYFIFLGAAFITVTSVMRLVWRWMDRGEL
ncbi:MAG: AarF/UbiB family protein, partial [Methylotetracoccus sp.]|nr:AarF/UbiB family protein [Methylotetracoccus sp.]